MRLLGVLGLLTLVGLVAACPAAAAPTIVEFPLPISGGGPYDVATGPDGNLWVARYDAIDRVTPAGVVTQFPTPGNPGNRGIAAGPDGRLWYAQFSDVNDFGRIDVNGNFANVHYTPDGQMLDLALGPDGNMWAAIPFVGARVTKFAPSGAKISDFNAPANRAPFAIVSGPEGALWFVEHGNTMASVPDRFVRMTTSGVRTEFPIPLGRYLSDIAAGPDGNLWATEGLNGPDGPTFVSRLTPAGVRTVFDLAPGSNSAPIANGPDGNLWATILRTGEIARIKLDGTVDRYPLPTPNSQPSGLTAGPDGNLWVLEGGTPTGDDAIPPSPKIARITPESPSSGGGGSGGSASGAGPSLLPPDLDSPGVTGLRAVPAAFVVGPGATPLTGVAARRRPRGTTFRYVLSEAATASLRIERALPGRRLRGTCRKPKRGAKGRRCTRYRAVGTLTRMSKAGANAVAFTGRIGRRKLAPGSYQVVASARDDAGNVTGRPPTARFRVLRR